MADPLTQAANQIAPAPASTNYFDPEPGRNVISRYGQSRALGESLQGALRLSGLARSERLGQIREPVEAMKADEFLGGAGLRERERDVRGLELDREEQDLLDRKEFALVEGELARDLWSLDPESPTYEQDYRRALSVLPESAKESPSISAALDYHKLNIGEKAKLNTWRQQEAERQNTLGLRTSLAAIKAAGGMELDADEQEAYRRKHTAPDGTLDTEGFIADIMAKGRGKERGADIEEYKTKSDITEARQKRVMSVRQQMAAAEQAVEENPVAFPDQLDILRRSHIAAKLKLPTTEEMTAKQFRDEVTRLYPGGIDVLDDTLKRDDPVAYAEAAQWSKNKKDMERGAARRMSKKDYVEAVPGLSEKDKQDRAAFWEVFNSKDPEAADQAVDAPRVDMPGFESEETMRQESAKVLDAETAGQFLLQAGGDRDKARQLAREAGYEF